jgi:peptidoglycan/LPS O-acetylase OafA/YrhL
MLTGLDYHEEAAVILKRPDWLGGLLQFDQSLHRFIRYSLIGVYTSHTKELSYNPFLWTMSIEMVGSMMVFILCYLWKRLNNPKLLCVGLAVFLTIIVSPFGLFFAGMLLGIYRRQGFFEKLLTQRKHQFLAFAIVLTIFFISILTSGMLLSVVIRLITPLVAFLLVFCFYSQVHFKSFFCNKLSSFLGEISFPLYLVHFQVLISLMSWLVIQDFTTKGTVDQNAMLAIGMFSVSVSLIVASCFRFIERLILKPIDSLVLKVLI